MGKAKLTPGQNRVFRTVSIFFRLCLGLPLLVILERCISIADAYRHNLFFCHGTFPIKGLNGCRVFLFYVVRKKLHRL